MVGLGFPGYDNDAGGFATASVFARNAMLEMGYFLNCVKGETIDIWTPLCMLFFFFFFFFFLGVFFFGVLCGGGFCF